MTIHKVENINGTTSYYSDDKNEARNELPVQFSRGDWINTELGLGIVSQIGVFTVKCPTRDLQGKYYVRLYVVRIGAKIKCFRENDLLALNPEKKLDEMWNEVFDRG